MPNALPNLQRNPDTDSDLDSKLLDPYGPGVFLAWVLVAFGIFTHFIFTPSRYDTIKYDFVATLAYPVSAAVSLIVQVRRFPASRDKLWTSTDEQLKPYTEAMVVCALVCVWGLAVNLFLCVCAILTSGGLLPKKRLSLLGVSSSFIFAALCFSGYRDWVAFLVVLFLLVFTPFMLYYAISFTLMGWSSFSNTIRVFRLRLRSFDSFRLEDLAIPLGMPLSVVLFLSMVAFAVTPVMFWSWMIPAARDKSVFDPSEAFALCLGGMHACFSLAKWYRRFGAFIWRNVYWGPDELKEAEA